MRSGAEVSEADMIQDYVDEIIENGGDVPLVWKDPPAMQIAKLQDVWRRL